MLEEHLHRAALEAGQALAVPLRVLAEEVLREQRQVFTAVALGWQPNLNRIQPEEQVLPEPAAAHLVAQVGVRRRDDPHVHSARARGSEALELSGLDHAKQLGLLAERD